MTFGKDSVSAEKVLFFGEVPKVHTAVTLYVSSSEYLAVYAAKT